MRNSDEFEIMVRGRMIKPDRTYSGHILDAITALSKDEDDTALSHANAAMDYALYKMMESVDSEYVKQAQCIRMTVFTFRRMNFNFKGETA
ncbi:hypothetical protein AU106_gp240 [Sinorhizobium phage phiM9]|uniref:Uncharacterized protein n=1 Tax=Sinorhizobium phage phiM9 TaxID=1636182 RepID=A0A0F6THB4_9CAUD|nr:hypothetical protein AU106_gp240 [Sinorhizobium phage phiM9]AKE44871.1 hypothetical protein Sm_phiM9_244 [Sinorhizobium phage phiM9]